MPTGVKVLVILSAALLPLALIAFFASLQTTRLADQEVRARLRIAIEESARSVRSELGYELRELRTALPATRDLPPNCGRLAGVFEPQAAAGIRYAMIDPAGRLLCGTPIAPARNGPAVPGESDIRLLAGRGVQIEVAGVSGHVARAFFPTAFITAAAEPSAMPDDYGVTLISTGQELTLREPPNQGMFSRNETQQVPVGVQNLALRMSVASAPINSSTILAAILPFVMWILAAGIAWFVVDRLLIRPLRRLRTTVGAYQPGELIDPVAGSDIPAQEIRALGDTFRELSRTVQAHESDLAEGLSRQTKLTREVHHRVKNNLQVIASLINFHARGAQGPEALAAYASIQRRVDSLAVVHRHHYAGFEETRGIELRPVIGELASNIRATAPEASPVGIVLDLEPLLVSQDSAVAIAFLITEMVELAMSCSPAAQVRITLKDQPAEPGRATLRISSPSLVESPEFTRLNDSRYGRIIGGLVRQLRSRLHHDLLVGAFELDVAITGRL
ncbi:histidine kinase [Sphingomonas turrisvirgatae]|uniref:histidine kinase n=2 Tax=Sphingomonas turrisvirgatae TaxID=1888892 RepID=A0A1E3LY72_9SPHN|nr:histidine kinase [Sphingomonas turrisvirgatae]